MKMNMIGENEFILAILVIFFSLFLYVFLKSRKGSGFSINEILGLSGKGTIQEDYKRSRNNKRRRKFF